MKDQVKFSDETYGDSFFSSMFKEWMTANKNHHFRIQWARQCMKRGIKKAWICIDGSNNDTSVTGSNLAAKGKAKSRKNTDIVTFIWAVDAEDGTPITFFVNNGSTVDSKSFSLINEFLKSADIEVSGIILDRGFCNHEVITELNKLEYPYVIMLKSNTTAHTEMVKDNAEKIRWRVDKLVNEHGIFGITEEKKLFANHPEKAYTTLFYDGKNGGERSLTLINKVFEADTNETIARLNRINFVLMVDGVYRAVNDISLKQQAIIDELGLNTSYFKYIAEDVNCRLNNPIHSQIRRLPDESEQLSKRGKSKKSETKKSEKASDGNTSKLSRCPKNSKIKNQSSEKQTEQSSLGVKRGPGRPKGSKNKPKNRP